MFLTLTNVSASSKSSPNLVRCFVVDNEATLKIDSVEADDNSEPVELCRAALENRSLVVLFIE